MKDYKLKVNPELIDDEMEYIEYDPCVSRFFAIVIFCITMLMGVGVESNRTKFEYVIKDGHTKKEFMEYYKEMYIMYSGNGGAGHTNANNLAIKEARGLYCYKKQIDRISTYKNPLFVLFIILSILLFVSSDILRLMIHRKLLNQLKYDMGEEYRIRAEEFEKLISDPTFDPLNKKL